MKLKLRTCQRCKEKIQSISPARKYCFDCRKEMMVIWSRKSRVTAMKRYGL